MLTSNTEDLSSITNATIEFPELYEEWSLNTPSEASSGDFWVPSDVANKQNKINKIDEHTRWKKLADTEKGSKVI